MPRYALQIDYHGGGFAGWQRQSGQVSVQEVLEAALRQLEPAMAGVVAAGRTDAGVHATAQVVHCDLERPWDAFRLREALNFHLRGQRVAVLAAAPVPADFHARFSALERRYLFRIQARRAPLTHDAGLVWRVVRRLDLAAMRAGAACLVGKHDFTTFRAAHCQARSPVKTLDEIRIEERPVAGGLEYRIDLRARSFLHNQVRSIVGTLERVGAGAWEPDRVRAALEARNRAECGPVCPPDGLYLAGVSYRVDPFGLDGRA